MWRGELIDSVLSSTGPMLVGSWRSADAGLDVATWTPDGETWVRHNSTGTALASTRVALGFPIDATAFQLGTLVVGWQLAAEPTAPTMIDNTGCYPWSTYPSPCAKRPAGRTRLLG